MAPRLTVLVACAAILSVSACASPPSNQDSRVELSPSPPTSPQTLQENSTTALRANIADIVGGEPDELTFDTLPSAPTGFTDAEVAALGERAIDVVERGMSPDLADQTPTQAIKYVFANQYPASTDAAVADSKAAVGDYDWEWLWASLFEPTPTDAARILATRWSVNTTPGELANGTAAPLLRVSLSAAIEQLVPLPQTDSDPNQAEDSTVETLHPIVSWRTIIVSGYEPLGDASYWPGIGVQAGVLFGGKCAPVNGSIVTPALNPTTLARDLKMLRRLIHGKSLSADASNGPSSLNSKIVKYCED